MELALNYGICKNKNKQKQNKINKQNKNNKITINSFN